MIRAGTNRRFGFEIAWWDGLQLKFVHRILVYVAPAFRRASRCFEGAHLKVGATKSAFGHVDFQE